MAHHNFIAINERKLPLRHYLFSSEKSIERGKNCMVFKYSILVPNISTHKDKNKLVFYSLLILSSTILTLKKIIYLISLFKV